MLKLNANQNYLLLIKERFFLKKEHKKTKKDKWYFDLLGGKLY
jgi:hypothetical protein